MRGGAERNIVRGAERSIVRGAERNIVRGGAERNIVTAKGVACETKRVFRSDHKTSVTL